MERQELTNYLKDVFELEHQLYTYQEIEKIYRAKIKVLGNPEGRIHARKFSNKDMSLTSNDLKIACAEIDGKVIKNKDFYNSKECQKIIRDCMNPFSLDEFKAKAFRKRILGIIMVLFGIFCFSKGADGFTNSGAVLPFIIGGIIGFFGILKFIFSFEDWNSKDEKIYRLNGFYEYKFREAFEETLKKELPIKNKLQKELNEMIIPQIKETKKLLSKLYSNDVIFPKYRNFIAISQIYEYMLSGRCIELEGPHGAYNLFEDELRHNIIINKLDQIINKLDELIDIMGSICCAINNTNRLLNNISNTLGRIESNTALTAYNTQCVAYNTQIRNQYYY